MVREPDREQLLLGVALLERTRSEARAARRVAESELAAHLLAEATGGEILARPGAGLGLPERPRVELGCSLQQCPESVVPPPLLLLLGRRLLVLELDPEPARQNLDPADGV